jgi:membrane protein implicated in regulation of membrane protease activity
LVAGHTLILVVVGNVWSLCFGSWESLGVGFLLSSLVLIVFLVNKLIGKMSHGSIFGDGNPSEKNIASAGNIETQNSTPSSTERL